MKNLLLGSSALFAFSVAAGMAHAACTPTTNPTSGQSVDCTGSNPNVFIVAAPHSTNVSVTVENDGNVISGVAGPAISIDTKSSITLLGNAVVRGTVPSGTGILLNGTYSSLTMSGRSRVDTLQSQGTGVTLSGHSTMTLNDSSYVSTYGSQATAVNMTGDASTLQMTGDTRLVTSAVATKSYGIDLLGSVENITLNGTAKIQTFGTTSHGLRVDHDSINDVISLQGGSQIHTEGTGAIGLYVAGSGIVSSFADSAFIYTKGNDAAGAALIGYQDLLGLYGHNSVTTLGSNAIGIVLSGLTNTVVMGNDSKVVTKGAGSTGIYIADTDGLFVMNDTSKIDAQGTASDAIQVSGVNHHLYVRDNAVVQSLNGNGILFKTGAHKSFLSVAGHASITTQNNNRASIQVQNQDPLNGDTITLQDNASVIALGAYSQGILIGGGGAVAANGNKLVLYGQALVEDRGNNSTGVFVVGDANSIKNTIGATISATGINSVGVELSGGNNELDNAGIIKSSHGSAIIGDDTSGKRDTVMNIGTISGGPGVAAIDLKDGDDHLVLGSGSHIDGGIQGGAGDDTVFLTGTSTEDDVFDGFEHLIVSSLGGAIGPDWTLSNNSTFGDTVDIQSGKLTVNGIITTTTATVEKGATLAGTGKIVGNVVNHGTIATSSHVLTGVGNGDGTGDGQLDIDGGLTQDGGSFHLEAGDAAAIFDNGVLTLLNAPTVKVAQSTTSTGGVTALAHATGGVNGALGATSFAGNGAATTLVTANDISVISVDGTPVVAGDFAAGQAGLDFLDTIGDEQLAGLEHCGPDQCDRMDGRKHLWAQGFGKFGSEAASDGNQGFHYRVAGTAFGADMHVTKDLSLGASGGYSNTEEDLAHRQASSDIDTGQLSLYANWQHGPFFVTGLLSGGWQSLDLRRQVGPGGADEATANSHAWPFGSSIQAGMQLSFPKGWRLTPSAGIAYQHQWVNGATEHGGGDADVTIKDHQTDALRFKAQLEIANDIPIGDMVLTPHFSLGVQQEETFGGKAHGTFVTGDDFTLDLKDDSKTMGVAGAGLALSFANGLATYVDYTGVAGTGHVVHSITGGIRYSW